jgi:hypothetical protein
MYEVIRLAFYKVHLLWITCIYNANSSICM